MKVQDIRRISEAIPKSIAEGKLEYLRKRSTLKAGNENVPNIPIEDYLEGSSSEDKNEVKNLLTNESLKNIGDKSSSPGLRRKNKSLGGDRKSLVILKKLRNG
jgi:hypothetical protein